MIEPGPKQELEDLQLSQRPIIGPSEPTQPRRSERICLHQEKTLPRGQLQDLKLEKTQKIILVF